MENKEKISNIYKVYPDFSDSDFIIGEDSFDDVEITDSANENGFWYFKNIKKGLIQRFVLERTQQIEKICNVTLIKKENDNFTPRFNFQIWNITNKACVQFSKKLLDHNLIKASVNLNSCHENFSQLIGFIKNIEEVNFGISNYAVIDKEKIEKIDTLAKKFNDLNDLELQELLANRNLKGKDFVNLAFRHEGLNIFRKWIEEDMDDEKKWQIFFKNHDWIFGYGFDYRFMTIFDREMSVGDGGTEDQNKPKVDFLNEFSDFTVLVEIKTPKTIFFESSKNRAGCWQLGKDFIDAYSQALEQKAEWSIKGDKGNNKSNDGNRKIETRTRDPKIILVIGNKKKQIINIDNITEKELKQDTFELFRRGSKNIEIITYDELFERAEFIVNKK